MILILSSKFQLDVCKSFIFISDQMQPEMLFLTLKNTIPINVTALIKWGISMICCFLYIFLYETISNNLIYKIFFTKLQFYSSCLSMVSMEDKVCIILIATSTCLRLNITMNSSIFIEY